MLPGDYPTPAQVSVFVDDIWVDDAIRIDFKDEAEKHPLYGYRDRRPAAFADGRSFVAGSICINFRFPGYLYFAIVERAGEKAAHPDGEVEFMNRILEASVEDRIRLLDEAVKTRADHEVGRQMREAFGAYSESDRGRTIPNLLDRVARESVNFVLHFDDPDTSIYALSIKGVRFTGRNMAVNNMVNSAADMSASGAPLIETYTFVAETISEVRTPKEPSSSPTDTVNLGETSFSA